jgi:hypothetical protein
MLRKVHQPMLRHRSLATAVPGGFVVGGRRPHRTIPPAAGMDYNFLTPANPGTILPGQIILPTGNQGAMRVHFVDADSTNFAPVIQALTFLDEISFGGATWSISSLNINEYADYCIFPVVLKAGTIPVAGLYAVTVRRP